MILLFYGGVVEVVNFKYTFLVTFLYELICSKFGTILLLLYFMLNFFMPFKVKTHFNFISVSDKIY